MAIRQQPARPPNVATQERPARRAQPRARQQPIVVGRKLPVLKAPLREPLPRIAVAPKSLAPKAQRPVRPLPIAGDLNTRARKAPPQAQQPRTATIRNFQALRAPPLGPPRQIATIRNSLARKAQPLAPLPPIATCLR
jgi:hypothetical protein